MIYYFENILYENKLKIFIIKISYFDLYLIKYYLIGNIYFRKNIIFIYILEK